MSWTSSGCTSFNKLADELEADAFRKRHTRVTGHDRP